jgi:uncharacterized protein (TIGR02246 family)
LDAWWKGDAARLVAATVVLVGGAAGGSAVAVTQSPAPVVQSNRGACQRPSEQEIADQFTGWDAALATGDVQEVADRYAPNAVLLPTVSNRVRTDRAGIVDYFEHFLLDKPQGTIQESYITVLDCNTALDTGTYRFTFGATGEQVDARYTFVYQKSCCNWLIVNHHSSKMPES